MSKINNLNKQYLHIHCKLVAHLYLIEKEMANKMQIKVAENIVRHFEKGENFANKFSWENHWLIDQEIISGK